MKPNNLIENNYDLIPSVVNSHIKNPPFCYAEKEDLISSANLGLVDAANKFEKEKHVSFKTFASKRIVGEMYDDIRRMRYGTVRNPKKTEQFSEKNEIPISYDQEIFYEEITSPLTSKEKEIFILYYRCNYNQKEIAEKLNMGQWGESRVSQILSKSKITICNTFKPHDLYSILK